MPVNINRYDEKITRRLFFSMVPVLNVFSIRL